MPAFYQSKRVRPSIRKKPVQLQVLEGAPAGSGRTRMIWRQAVKIERWGCKGKVEILWGQTAGDGF
ncbi:MAG: hypothetical protein CW342_14915 [Thermoactinomycetaceae bacterium]|nr:hypothetical protein [Thermoactinomycetaceae bacterium]